SPRICVRNPLFEEIKLDFKLALRAGFDDFSHYAARLRTELVDYLAPWLRDGAQEPQFGGQIAKSTLVDFIEERPYVDFITDVRLQLLGSEPNLEVARATTARSILVPAPITAQVITPYSAGGA
ncbi:MAG TPA: hypothetical protein VN764_13110, partial [Polyangiaceae bacterium]|nr:hypothetical protein [Polyangiaceae bacterium]